MMLPLPPPDSVNILLERAQGIAGKTLGRLAADYGETLPPNLVFAKGWVGQFIEKVLGAEANNLDQPDFLRLGIELKTLPISPSGLPKGSTYICTAPIPNPDRCFATSRVWRKMANMLWIPIEAHPHKPLAEQKIGQAIRWTAYGKLYEQLRQDWEELMEIIALGQFEALSAHKGEFLQIRPKAANAKKFIQVINSEGEQIAIVPKGFYVRRALTRLILAY